MFATDFRTLVLDQKQIIAAIVAGIFAVTAAYIRRDKRLEKTRTKKPVRRLLAVPFLYLIAGAGLLAAEFFCVNVNPKGDLSLDNTGAILCLAGCVLVVAGVVWLPVNVVRLLKWPKPAEVPAASVPASSSVFDSRPAAPARSPKAKPGK